ncbi:MAG TPA: DUF3883 domain-containing protein [Bacteroidetes bacterium]|nr:DUF3883 domain-containing protein [Bacteroidota bacterium]HEX05035.1 DUF3883 domain-containing protein [Bacteroidota bacterium]
MANRLVYRSDEDSLDLVEMGRPWSFDADGQLLRLVSEAYRISLAWLFDPYLAITTSLIEPLPHQISAAYEEMLPRQPMRFLLADDPGAGKTIMAGLLIRELIVRGDLERCLIIAPGSLTDQWQDELAEKFGLEFEPLTHDMIESARDGNPFDKRNLLIARMDQLSRNDELQEKLQVSPEWDLVVVDEAHKMSAHFTGGEVRHTKRRKLGDKLSHLCRNFLLMTATPHNGVEEDFQLFLALLDGDRYEGRFRDGVHVTDPSDLMRRLVKEDLLRFDGRPLFPERKSYTVQYELSDPEAWLYKAVTDYVRDEMNRADRFVEGIEKKKRINVTFALLTLQRRLASSPEAIYQSLVRRRDRLESRLRSERLEYRGAKLAEQVEPDMSEEEWEEMYEEAPQDEREEMEQTFMDRSTAAQTIEELEKEIERLKELVKLAETVRNAKTDAKWSELKSILDHPLMKDDDGNRRKLVIFTEFKDTLFSLATLIRVFLGKNESVVEIHGGVKREDRRKIVNAFMNDPDVLILVANDAAGEGVNLQRAHLMVNYDLPWNPNRLEQRFGRIHRIGQNEVCHLWNLLAKDTREGDVYYKLLKKLEIEREALGGKVFDVLGQLFDQRPLRELLMEAIRYGNDPEIKARLDQVLDNAVDRDHLRQLLEKRSLVRDSMDTSQIETIREEMERAHARRLQPNYIQAFFMQSFRKLGGRIKPREKERFEITHVPKEIRDRDRQIGVGAPVLSRYERVCFEKSKVDAQPRAYLICPGTPLLDATIDLILEKYREVMKRGAVLIDESDPGLEPRLLFYLQHTVHDGRQTRNKKQLEISTQMQFVEVTEDGPIQDGGVAPYLDYQALQEDELELLKPVLDGDWLKQNWEEKVKSYAISEVVPKHVEAVKDQRLPLIDKVEQEVQARLKREINYWDRRAEDLKAREAAGHQTSGPAQKARDRANRLEERLKSRLAELDRERKITAKPPIITGGALIIPAGLFHKLKGDQPAILNDYGNEGRDVVERLAMEAVFAAEHALGRETMDVHTQRGIGYDIESKHPQTGELRFIEVKGRAAHADQVSLTRTEILCALNEPEKFHLAFVRINDGKADDPVYVKNYDYGQPGFEQTSSTFPISSLMRHGGQPS